MKHILGVPSSATGVYLIRNLFDGKCYAGSSADSLVARCNKHHLDLRKGRHGNWLMKRAWQYAGDAGFEFSVLELCAKGECIRREQHWIDTLRPEYNILPTAGSPLGSKRSQESIEKVRLANIGTKRSMESRLKMSAAAMGHKRCVGRFMSPETREKIRQANLHRKWRPPSCWKHPPEMITRFRAMKLGKKASPETRAKMRQSRKNYLLRKHQNKKTSEHHHLSPDQHRRTDHRAATAGIEVLLRAPGLAYRR